MKPCIFIFGLASQTGYLPLVCSASESDEKILIVSESVELEKASQNRYAFRYLHLLPNVIPKGKTFKCSILCKCRIVLDLSSIKGGAPARTRGLNMYLA